MSECYWSLMSIVVDSQGYVKPCCNMSGSNMIHLGNTTEDEIHIENIESLEDYLLNDFMLYLRGSLKDKGIVETPECSNCKLAIQNNVIGHHEYSKPWSNSPLGRIAVLEITTSNICNQTCITCSSYFSSKWKTIDHLFGNYTHKDSYSLSDSAIDKIIDLLPNLKQLYIKGGEPFSDLKNAKILEVLIDVNPECEIIIVTNASIISKKFLDILKKAKPHKVIICGSLDHVGRKYEWIRGTSFNQTLQTIEKLYQETGIKTKPIPTISYFNILDLKEIADFYINYEYTDWTKTDFYHFNFVRHPEEMDFINTRTQEELDKLGMGLVSRFDKDLYENLKSKIEIMNDVRGFRWQDC